MNEHQRQFQNLISEIKSLASRINLSKSRVEAILSPDRIITVSLPVKLDSGQTEIFTGFRVQFDNTLGPYKGGLRYHPELDLDEAKTLALLMVLKCASAQLPFGGGKGGVQINPKKLSAAELERLTREFTRRIADFIGPQKDVPAPDVGTNAQVMKWVYEEYSKIVGKKSPAVVTDKPVNLGGIPERESSTGLGGFYALETILKKMGKTVKDIKVSIQGFGNVGIFVALNLFINKAKIVTVADSTGAIFNSEGLDIPALIKFKKEEKTVVGFPGSTKISTQEVLLQSVDVLIPAALENQITQDNATKIKAKVILELANGPTTLEAEKILAHRKILVVPDIVANAGGVIGSYFEWYQNIRGERWTKEATLRKLKQKMRSAVDNMWQTSHRHNVTLRQAAMIVALKRIAKRNQ